MMSSVVTPYEYQVHEQKDTKDVLIEDPEPEGQVQNSIAAHKLKRNIWKSSWFSDMVVACALLVEVVKDSVPFIFREVEFSSEFALWKNAIV